MPPFLVEVVERESALLDLRLDSCMTFSGLLESLNSLLNLGTFLEVSLAVGVAVASKVI